MIMLSSLLTITLSWFLALPFLITVFSTALVYFFLTPLSFPSIYPNSLFPCCVSTVDSNNFSPILPSIFLFLFLIFHPGSKFLSLIFLPTFKFPFLIFLSPTLFIFLIVFNSFFLPLFIFIILIPVIELCHSSLCVFNSLRLALSISSISL